MQHQTRYDFLHSFPNFFMNTLPSLFESSLVLYIPLGVFLTFALLVNAGLHVTGAKPEGVAKAVGCMIIKTLGLVLLGLSVVQIAYGLITTTLPATQTLLALVLLFVTGLGLIIHESRIAAAIDKASSSVANLVFVHSCRVIGSLVAVIAGLSLMMTFMVTGSLEGTGWAATFLLMGSLLSLTTSVHGNGGVKRKAAAKRKR